MLNSFKSYKKQGAKEKNFKSRHLESFLFSKQIDKSNRIHKQKVVKIKNLKALSCKLSIKSEQKKQKQISLKNIIIKIKKIIDDYLIDF